MVNIPVFLPYLNTLVQEKKLGSPKSNLKFQGLKKQIDHKVFDV